MQNLPMNDVAMAHGCACQAILPDIAIYLRLVAQAQDRNMPSFLWPAPWPVNIRADIQGDTSVSLSDYYCVRLRLLTRLARLEHGQKADGAARRCRA
jgi:hypothetical protein